MQYLEQDQKELDELKAKIETIEEEVKAEKEFNKNVINSILPADLKDKVDIDICQYEDRLSISIDSFRFDLIDGRILDYSYALYCGGYDRNSKNGKPWLQMGIISFFYTNERMIEAYLNTTLKTEVMSKLYDTRSLYNQTERYAVWNLREEVRKSLKAGKKYRSSQLGTKIILTVAKVNKVNVKVNRTVKYDGGEYERKETQAIWDLVGKIADGVYVPIE